MYDAARLNVPHKVIQLQNNSRFSLALGESFVSMAFAPRPVEQVPASSHVLYLLTGSGSIFQVYLTPWPTDQ